jgi:hemerythrin superfamily protein
MLPRRRAEFVRSMLSEDHAQIEALFEALAAEAAGGEPDALTALWDRFERQLVTHMELEEQELLPQFAGHDQAEARALLDQHAEIRARLTALRIDLDLRCLRAAHVVAFVALLREHALREERAFYPWASRMAG